MLHGHPGMGTVRPELDYTKARSEFQPLRREATPAEWRRNDEDSRRGCRARVRTTGGSEQASGEDQEPDGTRIEQGDQDDRRPNVFGFFREFVSIRTDAIHHCFDP